MSVNHFRLSDYDEEQTKLEYKKITKIKLKQENEANYIFSL